MVKQKLHRLSGAPFHSAVCHAFCVPPSSSWQPPLSCKQLYSLRLHFTSGLRCAQHPYVSFRLHSFQQLTVHRLPIIGSPAGRHRLRGCHGFCKHGWYNLFLSGSHAEDNKNTRHPLAASSSHPPASSLSLSVCHRWLHSQTARAEKNKTSAMHCIRFVFLRKDSITAGLFLDLIVYSILKHSKNQIPE